MTREQARGVVWAPLAAWGALLALLVVSIAYAHLSRAPAKAGVEMLIAATMAGLIAWVLMRLSAAAGLVRLAAAAGLFWGSLLYLFAFADFLTR